MYLIRGIQNIDLYLSKYKDVMRPSPQPRSTEVLSGHARARGSQCGYEYAEAFQSVFKRGI